MPDASRESVASLYEQAWQIEQAIARDEYMGHPPDLDALARQVGQLALIVAELAEKLDA